MKKMKFNIYLLVLIAFLISCKGKTEKKNNSIESTVETFDQEYKIESTKIESIIETFDYENKEELNKYSELNLDATHPNLLNPKISEKDYDMVMKSWTDLHQNIGKYLDKNDFEWEIDEPEISVFHKFYFEPNGKIKSYFYRVWNKNVTSNKRKEYAKLISEFAKTHQIDFKKDHQFAQCGKTKYLKK